jgi:tetratricopeptide (TPR) repeat protein
LVVSAPSLLNGFAYDDRWIIVENGRVHSLDQWAEWLRTSYWPTGDTRLYRPLTSALFALQWVVGGGTPLIFHAVNVALHIAAAVAFTWLASLLLPPAAALVVGALFAAHPLHVEAVANVVGQSELSAGVLMLVAMAVYLRARRTGGPTRGTAVGIAVLYPLAIALKEHALVLPAWFALAECTVLRRGEPWRTRTARLGFLIPLLAAGATLSLVARYQVLGALGGDVPHPVFDHLDIGGRALVMLGVLPDLARLLIWPARLSADYGPAQLFVSATPDLSQINGLLVIAAGLVALAVAWKRSAPAAFGLLAAALAWFPTANLVFPSGILLSERTLFLPSAGALLALGAVVSWFDQRYASRRRVRAVAAAVVGVALTLGFARSADRARVWRSTEEVLATTVRDAPLSFKAHYAWGALLFERGDLSGGEREWRLALRLFPDYHMIYQDLAHRYREHHLCTVAIPLYEQALVLDGGLPLSRAGLLACQLELARFSAARETARQAIRDGVDPRWFRARLFTADSALAATTAAPRRRAPP